MGCGAVWAPMDQASALVPSWTVPVPGGVGAVTVDSNGNLYTTAVLMENNCGNASTILQVTALSSEGVALWVAVVSDLPGAFANSGDLPGVESLPALLVESSNILFVGAGSTVVALCSRYRCRCFLGLLASH